MPIKVFYYGINHQGFTRGKLRLRFFSQDNLKINNFTFFAQIQNFCRNKTQNLKIKLHKLKK
jgi:hypothetical protein